MGAAEHTWERAEECRPGDRPQHAHVELSVHDGGVGCDGPAAAAIGNGLLKNYNMKPDDVRFFTVHTEADEDHSSLAQDIAVRYLHSPHLQEQTRKHTFRRMELLYDIWSIEGYDK